MIEKIAIYLVGQMTETKLIDKHIEERYTYALICWIEKFIGIGTIMMISIVAQKFLQTLFFLIFFLKLRKRTGGYHLDKFYQCYLATVASYLIILLISVRLADYPIWLLGMLFLSMLVIGIIGTVNHPNIHMDLEELEESKNAARIIVLLEGSIICGCILLGADMVFISYMTIAVILCAVLLCIAKILKQEVIENEQN